MAEYWGLAAYPPPATWVQQVSSGLDGPLRVTTLGELRTLGSTGLVKRLRSVRADVGLLLEDGNSGPLAPALLMLLAMTRCGRLEAVDRNGLRRRLSRGRAVAAAVGMVAATVRGLFAAWACSRELHALESDHHRVDFPSPLRRVAVLRTNLWYGVKAGGSVGHFAGVVNALARRGIDVSVLAPEPQPMIDPGVPMLTIPAAGEPAYPYELNYYRYHRRFVRDAIPHLRALKPDAIYHRLSLGSWAGVSIARRLGIPLIVEYNGSEVWVSRNWGRALRFERLAARGESRGLLGADVVTVVSQPLADEVRAQGVPAERIVVHPNGVDTTLFDPARFSAAERLHTRRAAGIPDEAVVCTFVGTFGPWHGVEVLAASIRLLAADATWTARHRMHFLLIGDGAMMAAARRELDPLGKLVTFAGLRPQHETPQWLAASDILLSPHVPNPDGTPFFGSPTKVFEYMSMARPIVASALDQIAEVLQPAFTAGDLPARPAAADVAGRVAVLSRPGSAAEFSAGIRFVVDNPQIRAAIGSNARAAAEARYTWQANVHAVLARCERLSSTRTGTSQ